jgi:hypothetical protein
MNGLFQRFDDERIQAFAGAESQDGKRTVEVRACAEDEFAGIFLVCRSGERAAVAAIDFDPFVDDLAKLPIDGFLIVPVTAIADPARDGSDIALVLLGPADQLEIRVSRFHCFDSSIFARAYFR